MDTNIKIVGLGEGGTKIISKLIQSGVKGVEFIAIGTDENIMLTSATRKNIFLNRDLPLIYKTIYDALQGAKVISIVGGLAGNASRVAIPIITSYAKTYEALTVVFVCKPSVLENPTRKINADYTMNHLHDVDTLFNVPAEKFFVFRINQSQISLDELFDVADDVFCQGVKILLELNEFKFGKAAFGYAEATTALEAVKLAAKFPTFEENELKTAQKIFIRLTSGKPLPRNSINTVNKFIKSKLKADAKYSSRTDVVPSLGDKVFASIICTRQ